MKLALCIHFSGAVQTPAQVGRLDLRDAVAMGTARRLGFGIVLFRPVLNRAAPHRHAFVGMTAVQFVGCLAHAVAIGQQAQGFMDQPARFGLSAFSANTGRKEAGRRRHRRSARRRVDRLGLPRERPRPPDSKSWLEKSEQPESAQRETQQDHRWTRNTPQSNLSRKVLGC